MLGLWLCLALRAGAVSVGAPPPVLVMIRTAGTTAFEKSQAKLHDELTVLLDGFMILATPLDTPNFSTLPLAEQLEAVLPLSRANDAVAVVWMAEPLPGHLMLHVVATGSGRTLVRTLDFDRKSRSESALALMLRELLGTAFLYEKPQALPESVRTVVQQARSTMPALPSVIAADPVPPARAPAPSPRRVLTVVGTVEAGLGRPPVATTFGGAVSGEAPLGPVRVGVELGATGASARLSSLATHTAVLATGELVASAHFGSAAWRLGPRAGGGVEVGWVTTTGNPTALLVGPHARVGLEVLAGEGALRLVARLEVTGRLRRAQVIENASASVVWSAAWASVTLSVGFAWEGI